MHRTHLQFKTTHQAFQRGSAHCSMCGTSVPYSCARELHTCQCHRGAGAVVIAGQLCLMLGQSSVKPHQLPTCTGERASTCSNHVPSDPLQLLVLVICPSKAITLRSFFLWYTTAWSNFHQTYTVGEVARKSVCGAFAQN